MSLNAMSGSELWPTHCLVNNVEGYDILSGISLPPCSTFEINLNKYVKTLDIILRISEMWTER